MRTVDGWLRHVAPGGGETCLELTPGDQLRVTDPEGGQPGELLLAAEGAPPPGLDWSAPDAEAGEAPAWLRGSGAAQLYRAVLFGPDSAPGSTLEIDFEAAARVVLRAPGAPMAPENQDTATPLLAEILPAESRRGQAPAPLAEPLLDLRITAGTAAAYTVRAGDYIQVIDVDGRQCSDFQAFHAGDLSTGHEYSIDPTTTRTLMGTASPGPGLHSRFFDLRQRPLVEVVRDTVGRHDTFMLACSAKYYDDMGYPGHPNCSENFNRALAPHGVAPRTGWPAINFFYNTLYQADDTITLDEPWSRPGDYVLLRALEDLVCVSSACPDDIDPANGWEPTDIHVRTYPAACNFSKGIAFRMSPDSEPRMTRETGFHAATTALTRRMVEYRGFWLPESFSGNGPIDEYWACRERAVLIDLSPLRKFEVTGPDAEALVQAVVTRDIRKLAVGQVVYTAFCHEHGGMLDDGTVFRLCQNNFRVVCGDEYVGAWLRELAQRLGLKVWVRSSTDQLHNVSLQGPRSRDILRTVLVTPPHQASAEELKWFRFTVGKIDGRAVVVSRTGYTGELGYEVWCHPNNAVAIWNTLMAAGEPHGIAPMGLSALDMVRIEAGLVFAGYDFCDQTDPFEAGIGFAVAADKAADYMGKAALERRRARPMRALVGLDIEGHECIHHGDPVYIGRAKIGEVTSATRSPVLDRNIALARLDISACALGTAVEVGKLDGLQKRIGANVIRFPHYDPEKTRVRA
jgi:aminomethyltransferase